MFYIGGTYCNSVVEGRRQILVIIHLNVRINVEGVFTFFHVKMGHIGLSSLK